MVYCVYFSPTGASKKNGCAAAEAFDENFTEIDLTVNTETLSTREEDIVIMSFPVYGGRIFKTAIERLNEIKGNKTPCICIVTYGNRAYDDALRELCDTASKNGFIPFSAAALIGRHTYGEIACGRPTKEDLEKTKDFFKTARERLLQKELKPVITDGNFPYKDGLSKGRFNPLTDENCIKCGLCAKKCPTQAISYENFKDIDSERCISCFRCIKICPVHSKNMNTAQYEEFAKEFSKKLSQPKENKYF